MNWLSNTSGQMYEDRVVFKHIMFELVKQYFLCTAASITNVHTLSFSVQYAAKEYQQALDILDMEEPINKRLFEKYLKDESAVKDCSNDWEISQTSVSVTQE